MMTSCPDPFCTYTTSDESSEIFTVLPPTSLISPAPHNGSPTPRELGQLPPSSQTYALTDTTVVPSALGDFADITYAYGYARDPSNINPSSYLRDPFLRVDMVGTQGGIVNAAVEETPLGRSGSAGGFVSKTTEEAVSREAVTEKVAPVPTVAVDMARLEFGRRESIAEVNEDAESMVENMRVTEREMYAERPLTVTSVATDTDEDQDTDVDVDGEETLLNSFAQRMTSTAPSTKTHQPLKIGNEAFNQFSFGEEDVGIKKAFVMGPAHSGYEEKKEHGGGEVRQVEVTTQTFGVFEGIVA
ncbi:hypothetical protein BC938DRAFT_474781 [Jimgerdemannia flammicorona]|uniref:Uncharacterized protein n=1 Tax=Jimgerdemannia flammicorona TaxID=994334 RepID=A0A433Q1M8_9FUNG|nr:hypothetical protein BC938DRAFT_474781 [Jimgerdemannia flammicorona]